MMGVRINRLCEILEISFLPRGPIAIDQEAFRVFLKPEIRTSVKLEKSSVISKSY